MFPGDFDVASRRGIRYSLVGRFKRGKPSARSGGAAAVERGAAVLAGNDPRRHGKRGKLMAPHLRAARRSGLATCVILALTAPAWSMATDLSSGMVRYMDGATEPWVVYAFDSSRGGWEELSGVNWRQVTTMGHSGYVIEAVAKEAIAASSYRVIVDVLGKKVEVFMIPSITQRLGVGETATLRVNLY
jgi:hypothetical protein